jgi:hypothetical protein
MLLSKSFVCQSTEDLDLLLSELRDKRKWRINAISVSSHSSLSDFKPVISYQRVRDDLSERKVVYICVFRVINRKYPFFFFFSHLDERTWIRMFSTGNYRCT